MNRSVLVTSAVLAALALLIAVPALSYVQAAIVGPPPRMVNPGGVSIFSSHGSTDIGITNGQQGVRYHSDQCGSSISIGGFANALQACRAPAAR